MPTLRDQRPRASAIVLAITVLGLLAGVAPGALAAGPESVAMRPPLPTPLADRPADEAPPASLAPPRSGCIQGDCRDGRGSYVWPNGARYIGAFRRGRQDGQGLLVLPDGSSYEGDWRAGRKQGRGVITYPDGGVLSGEWRDDRFVGEPDAGRLQPRWPDLSKAAPREIGGGERDAAVVIGLSRYAHLAPLDGATANAADWYGYLVRGRGVPQDCVALLLDEDATALEMRHAVEDAVHRVKKGGTLWFVFAGHGAPASRPGDGLLVGYGAPGTAGGVEAHSLRLAGLLDALRASPAASVQVLLDASFSGRTPGGPRLVADIAPRAAALPKRMVDPRLVVMTAAAGDEAAGVLPGMDRPAFGYLALGGLRGWADTDGDGAITAGELYEYLTRAIRILAPDRFQHPTLAGDDGHRLAESGREPAPDFAQLAGPQTLRN